jgi:predicted RNA-binding Zn-ribbon protein involved in translation (DUF1610 family)
MEDAMMLLSIKKYDYKNHIKHFICSTCHWEGDLKYSKRYCPECGTSFHDPTKNNTRSCVNGHQWKDNILRTAICPECGHPALASWRRNDILGEYLPTIVKTLPSIEIERGWFDGDVLIAELKTLA